MVHVLVIGGTGFIGPFVVRELHREPVPLETALRETITWERANPPREIDAAQFNYAAEDAALAALAT